jgi:hypothetical protein
MSNLSAPRRSDTKRFSREGFTPIPSDYQSNMAPNDATIDIPLEQVSSNGGGLRSQGSTTALNQEETNTPSEKRKYWSRGRRKKPEARVQKTGKVGYDGEEDTVNTMGHVYKKIANFSAVVSSIILPPELWAYGADETFRHATSYTSYRLG